MTSLAGAEEVKDKMTSLAGAVLEAAGAAPTSSCPVWCFQPLSTQY